MSRRIDCPYPGLRPFQEHESAYFFGRESQIKEIVNRLKNSRFVAVLGGSGSGKSSLILAGAIPELRAEAIEDAGDFWVPVITSPGTNPGNNSNENQSPITRLARRFCDLLELPDENALDACINFLRSENGLTLMIEEYGRLLNKKQRDGVNLQLTAAGSVAEQPSYRIKVNFLFLIDQFEELFHPSNERVKEDCGHLVNRIVEHFKQCKQFGDNNPYTRLCVAITMRSEHLNDCPRFADLPDAINASLYLVKRLNQNEIKEAIIRPADAFLRQEFRRAVQNARQIGAASPDKSVWPQEIRFSADVINVLLEDADKIVKQEDHADLLPLLQHLLYWIWICAVVRTREVKTGQTDSHCCPHLPDEITMQDLESAYITNMGNTLSSCLENRCELIYKRSEYQIHQACWKKIFSNLAYKEPYSGTYTQRRINIDRLCQNPEMGLSRKSSDLRTMLEPWLGNELGYHQYLFWDQDSNTLKVTHESLIRRWKCFREWIDWKDRQYMEYVQALENCYSWVQGGKKWSDLITDNVILDRLKAYELRKFLEDQEAKLQFTELLKRHRDKARLLEVEDQFEFFLNRSFGKQKVKSYGFGLLILLPVILGWGVNSEIEGLFKDKKDNLLRAASIAAETRLASPPTGVVEGYDQALVALRNFLASVSLKNKPVQQPWYDFIYKPVWRPWYAFFYKGPNLGWYAEDREKEYQYGLWSDSRVLGGLRSALLGRAWRPKPGAIRKGGTAQQLPCKEVEITGSDESKTGEATFISSNLLPSYRKGTGLIAVKAAGQSSESGTQVFWGRLEGGKCLSHIGQKLWWANKDSILGFDAYQNFLVEFQNLVDYQNDKQITQAATIVAIDWPIGSQPIDGQSLPTPRQFSLTNLKPPTLGSKETYASLSTLKQDNQFSEDIQIHEAWYRFFNRGPVAIDKPCETNDEYCVSGVKVSDADKGGQRDVTICADWLGKISTLGRVDVWQIQNNQEEVFCLVVSDYAGAKGMFFADLYKVRAGDGDHLPLISGLALGSKQPEAISLDFGNGWFFSRLDEKWFKQPWQTDAWVKLAAEIRLPLPLSVCIPAEGKSRYTKFKGHLEDKDFNLDDLAKLAVGNDVQLGTNQDICNSSTE